MKKRKINLDLPGDLEPMQPQDFLTARPAANNESRGKCLCLSHLLARLDKYGAPQLLKAVQVSRLACRVNAIPLFESRWFNENGPARTESGSTLPALRWIVKHWSKLQAEGMSALAIVSLPGSQRHQVKEIVKLLKLLRSYGIGLYLFDKDQNLIDMGSMDDVISSDDYLNIWVTSLAQDAFANSGRDMRFK